MQKKYFRSFLVALLLTGFFQYSKAQVNLNQGLIAFYPFNGNTIDASGNNNNGIPQNGVQLTTDRYGIPNSAYHFDGLDDYIQIPNNPQLNPGNSISIALYFYPEKTGVQTLIGKIGYGPGIGTQFQVAINFGLYPGVLFGVNDMSNGCASPALNGAYVNTGGGSLPINQWYCVVATFDNGVQKIYLNGTLIQTKNAGFTNLNQCSGADFQIGSWWSGDLQRFKGKIDDVRFYNRALNDDEVSALCATSQPSNFCKGSLGAPIVNIDFGKGSNPGAAMGTVAPGTTTPYPYTAVTGNPASSYPIEGQYTITNNIPSNSKWYSGFPDRTQGDVNGYMALFNSSEQSGEFFKLPVNNLCASTTYQFTIWIANVADPGVGATINPDITFRIEKPDGTLLAFYNTGPVIQQPQYTWVEYAILFETPADLNSVVIRLVNNIPAGGPGSGNDFAIDDITLRACGPVINASFVQNKIIDSIGLCTGSDTTLFGSISSGLTNPNYVWQTSPDGNTWTDIPSSNTINFKISTPITTGNNSSNKYRLAAADGSNLGSSNCRIFSNIITLTTTASLKLSITKDTVICQGTSVQLNVSGGSVYSWTPPQFLDNTAIANPIASPFAPTKYYVDAEDIRHCKGRDSVSISFVPLSNIGSRLIDTTVCAGSPVVLNPIVFSAPDNLYQWSPTQYLDDPYSAITTAKPETSVDYTLTVTDYRCPNAITTLFVKVKVNPHPSLTITPDTTLCEGSTLQLNASGASSYSWSPSQYLDNTSSANPVATLKDNTRFYVTATNSNNCSARDSVLVNLIRKPVLNFSGDTSVCIGSSIQFKGDNGNNFKYAWSPGTYLDDASSPNPVATPTETIQYNLNITDSYCHYDTNFKANVVVNPLPVITTQKSNDIDCNIPTAHLTASGGANYNWSPASALDNPNTNDPTASVDTTTLFSVIGTDINGCVGNSSIKVTVTLSGKGNFELPNAFTPNNDGHNDCFGVTHWGNIGLQEFNVYNRWGQNIFSTKDPAKCWDGTFNGKPQNSGAYPYIIQAKTLCGVIKRTGVVILVR